MEKFTDLILIVGTNPLPDYVVADYFLNHHHKGGNDKCERVWLICSNKTHELARNLEEVISKNLKIKTPKFEYVEINEISNAQPIQQKIENEIIKRMAKDNILHFNYTGGTKAMGIHTYRTLEKHEDNKCDFSYLDARNFFIVDDATNGNVHKKTLKEIVEVSFKDMLTLHSFNRINKDSDKDYSAIVTKYTSLIEDGKLWDSYYTKNKDGKYQENLENPDLQEIKSLLSQIGTKRIEKYLEGEWLEDYVYNHLKILIEEELSGFQILKDWVIRKSNWSRGIDFQLDVILIHGYELLGISCTAAGIDSGDKYKCKQKGFEVILRSQQIGGDEAKAVLITSLDEGKAEKLEEELKIERGGNPNIKVLGRDDWQKDRLCGKIQEFLEEGE